MTLGTRYTDYAFLTAARAEAQDWLDLLGQPGVTGPLALASNTGKVQLAIEGRISANAAALHAIPDLLADCLLQELLSRADTLLPAAMARLAALEADALLATEAEVVGVMAEIEQAKTNAAARGTS